MKVFAVNSEWHVPPHAIEIVARSAKLHIAQDVFDLARHFLCGYNHKTFLLNYSEPTVEYILKREEFNRRTKSHGEAKQGEAA